MWLCNKRVFNIMIAVEAHTLLFDLGPLNGWLQKSICFTGTLEATSLLGNCHPARECAWFEKDRVYKDKMQHGLGQAQSHFTAILAVY